MNDVVNMKTLHLENFGDLRMLQDKEHTMFVLKDVRKCLKLKGKDNKAIADYCTTVILPDSLGRRNHCTLISPVGVRAIAKHKPLYNEFVKALLEAGLKSAEVEKLSKANTEMPATKGKQGIIPDEIVSAIYELLFMVAKHNAKTLLKNFEIV